MKTITRSFAILALLCISVTSYANTVFIKYKSYLIPIDVREELKVVTQNATSIQSTSATLNLFIESGEPNLTAWFEFSQSSQPACASTPPVNTATLQSGDNYSLIQSNLLPASTYYYRACAIDDINEISSGEIISFRTANAPTIVSTSNASAVQILSARLNGQINSGTNITTWFAFGLSNGIQCSSPVAPTESNGYTGASRYRMLSSLSANTVYYYRFCGLGTDGVNSGAVSLFRTKPATAVTTLEATSTFRTSARLNGSITSGSNITTWFVYDTSSDIQCGAQSLDSAEAHGSTGDTRQFLAASLTSNTDYFFRMCALGEDGTKSGEILSFKTLADPTSVRLFDFSNRTDSGITYSYQVVSGQDVNTWYVRDRSSYNPTPEQCGDTRFGEQVLQAGEINTFSFEGLKDWTGYDYRFCAEGASGGVESIGGKFVTKRKSNKRYTVTCSDTRVYYSADGPMDFYVKARAFNDPFGEAVYAPLTIYNENNPNNGNVDFDGYLIGRGLNRYRFTIPFAGVIPPDYNGVWPASIQNPVDEYDRWYVIQLPGSENWRATLGCVSVPIAFKSQNDGPHDVYELVLDE